MSYDFKDKPLVVLTGPTAVGKTKLSINLAKAINGEIISADSIQVYQKMDIGSAKITVEEMQGIPHHLIDVLDPRDDFNVVIFQKLCKKAMVGIYERGHIPILTGGTGFYIQAILKDIDFTENDEDTTYRQELENLAMAQGCERLHEMLLQVDPESADAIPMQNIKRTIRALEYFKQTGQKISVHNKEEALKEPVYNFSYFVLNDKREKLYSRIEQRVDEMVQQGLVEEVQGLLDYGCTRQMVSMQGLGYKEIIDYLQGECTLEAAIDTIKLETRHFAKRQLTWFRREKNVSWVDRQDFSGDNVEDKMLEVILQELKEKRIVMD